MAETDELKIFRTEREYENVHVFLWLLKDTSWCHLWAPMGMVMLVPTLAVQLHLTWRARRDVHEVFHAVAVACWIAANGVWMTGELFFNDGWRGAASWFFSAGVAAMVVYYAAFFRRGPQPEAGSS